MAASMRSKPNPPFPPAIPRAKMASPELILVRTARQRLDAAKRELKVKADTAAKYWQAWEKSRARFGPAGDPELRRTSEVEMMLFRRGIETLVKPAAKSYFDALRGAILKRRFALSGSVSAEKLLGRLLSLEVDAQSWGDDFFAPTEQWRPILDKVAAYAIDCWKQRKDPETFKMCVGLIEMAAAVNVGELRSVEFLKKKVHEFIFPGDTYEIETGAS